MTLNATIFPDLGVPTIPVDFAHLVLGPDGASAELRRRRMDVYVDFLTQRLRQEPAWDSPRRLVVAHSFGGMLALKWWLAHGGGGIARVDGLVLIATTAGPMYRVVRLRLTRVGALDLRIPVEALLALWNRPAVTRAVKRLVAGSLETQPVDFRTCRRTSDLAVDLAGWRYTDWRAMRSFRLALDGFDVRAALGSIHVPAIVLHGTEDTLFPPAVGRSLATGLKRGEFRLVAGAAHALPLTHGKEVAQAVADHCSWLRRAM